MGDKGGKKEKEKAKKQWKGNKGNGDYWRRQKRQK